MEILVSCLVSWGFQHSLLPEATFQNPPEHATMKAFHQREKFSSLVSNAGICVASCSCYMLTPDGGNRTSKQRRKSTTSSLMIPILDQLLQKFEQEEKNCHISFLVGSPWAAMKDVSFMHSQDGDVLPEVCQVFRVRIFILIGSSGNL